MRNELSDLSGGMAPTIAARLRVLGLFTLAGLGAFLVSLDVSVANSLLSAIGRDYGVTSRAALSWVITAYAITFAAVLVPAGRIADRAGRRRVFLAGLGVFALGSLACGLAPDLGFLVAGRVVQGVGAAAASPASLGLLLQAVPPGRRAVASARWAGMGALGIGLGPIVGGLFTEAVSWRWAFLVNVPFIAVAWLSGPAVLPESGRHPGRRLPDPVGAVIFAAAAASVTLALSQTAQWGITDWRVAAAGLSGLGLAAVFARRCLTVADPVLDLAMLRSRQIAAANALMLLYSCGFFGLLFSFVLFLSGTWHLSLVQAGAALLPMVGIAFLLTTRVGHLANRVGFRTPLIAGPLCMAAGLMLSAALDAGAHFSARWLWLAGLVGLGIGLCYPLLGAAAVDGLGHGDLAAATAVNQCARQIGAALGVAAVVSVLGTRLPTPTARFHEAWMLCGVFCLAAAGAGLALRPRTSTRDGTLPPASPARQPEAVAE